jgi:glycosidase
LPAFNFDEKPEARAWSVADATWWANHYDIDGYRLDAIKHVPNAWLTEIRQSLKTTRTNPRGGRFYLVGETFSYDDRGMIKGFIEPNTKLDGQFDFPLKYQVCENIMRKSGSMADLAGFVAGNDSFYGQGAIMSNWIGNHDVPRAIHFATGEAGCKDGNDYNAGWVRQWNQPWDKEPYERLALAFAFMFTSPGVPMLYYGDEIGLAGGADPDNRRLMPWDDQYFVAQAKPHQEALRATVAQLARIRAQNRVLSRGSRSKISADNDTFVYRLSGCGAASADVIVALNRADQDRSVTLPAGAYDDLVAGGTKNGGSVTLKPRGFLILRAR